jgi:hypothetical protein
MKLTSEETKQLIAFYYAHDKSPTVTARHFNNWALANNHPARVSKKNVIDAIKRFEVNTDLKHAVKGRTPASSNEGTLLNVLSALYNQRGSSLRTAAVDTGLSLGTVHTIARHVLGLRPYRLGLTQTLSEFDKIVRVEACHHLLPIIETAQEIIYSDEASFRTDGHVNRWNCYLWDYSRPEQFVVEADQGASRVTVWAGISTERIFGPYFFPGTVTAEVYQAMLTEILLPDILQQRGTVDGIWFQQDGAPAHTANSTKTLLQNLFGERIVSSGLPHEWPPRSPDLTPCDFYLWSAVSELVYANGGLSNETELRDALLTAFTTLRQEHMEHVKAAVLGVPARMRECIGLNGRQLHHR